MRVMPCKLEMRSTFVCEEVKHENVLLLGDACKHVSAVVEPDLTALFDLERLVRFQLV